MIRRAHTWHLWVLVGLVSWSCTSTESGQRGSDASVAGAGQAGGGSGGMPAAGGAGGAPPSEAGGSGGVIDARADPGGSDATTTVDADDGRAVADAGGEAASPDAGGEAASPDAGVLCRTGGTDLCEDFESGALDPKIWGMHTSGGASLLVDKAHAHTGIYALHVKVVAGQQSTAQITDAVTFPAKDNTFYTRAWVYFSPDLPADNMGGFHMAYLLATGNNDLGFVEAGLGSAGDKQYLGYSEYYGAGPGVHAHGPTFTEFGPDSPTRIVPNKWICLELMQGGDATTSTTTRRVWVDDKELPEQKNSYAGRKPPAFDLMSIGVLQYHPTPLLADVWFDDVRVSSTRIGCAGAPP
jgi:hypothetical protein